MKVRPTADMPRPWGESNQPKEEAGAEENNKALTDSL
jgi:hypothetical protein